jgi:hypothetical protein
MEQLPSGGRTTLVISSTPSGTVARSTTAPLPTETVVPREITQVEIDGERVFKDADLAALATATSAPARAATGDVPETPIDVEPAPAQPEPAAPAPSVRVPGVRRPTVEADPTLPGATPSDVEVARPRSTVRVIGEPGAASASEPVPEVIAPAPAAPAPTPTPMPAPRASTAAVTPMPEPAPQRVTTVPSREGVVQPRVRPVRRSQLGRSNGSSTERAQFSLNLSEQIVGPRPQGGKVTIADILEATEQQEGETPVSE